MLQVRLILKITAFFFCSITSVVGQVIDVSDLYSANKYFFPEFIHLNETAGFPYYRINNLFEDHEGYLWISTSENGLVKYDGHSFLSYKHETFNTYSLPSNNVFFAFEDSRNIIWVGTDNGLCYFHPVLRRFVKIKINDSTYISSSSEITSAIESNGGQLIVSCGNKIIELSGINRLELINYTGQLLEPTSGSISIKEFTLIEEGNKINNVIQDLKFGHDGTLWCCFLYKVGYAEFLESDEMPTERITNDTLNFITLTATSWSFQIDVTEDGTVWAVTQGELIKIEKNKDSYSIEEFNLTDNCETIDNYAATAHGSRTYWVGYPKNELTLFDEGSKKTYPVAFESKDKDGLYGHGVTCMNKTRSNVIYIGTAWGGLFKFNPDAVLSYFHPNLQNTHLQQVNNLRYVYEDDEGYLWMIANDIYKCNRFTGEIIKTFDKDFFDGRSFYKNYLLQDLNGNIWIGHEGDGIICISENKIPTGYSWDMKYHLLEGRSITAMTLDDRGYVWAGTHHKEPDGDNWNVFVDLYKISTSGKIVEKYPIKSWNHRMGLERNHFIYQVHKAENGYIWLATAFGLIKIAEEDKTMITYSDVSNDSISIDRLTILSLIPDPHTPENKLWLGTAGSGLFSFGISEESFRHFNNSEIKGKYLNSILSDQNGDLLIGTNDGIVKATLAEDHGSIVKLNIYDKLNGLVTNDLTFYYGHNAVKTRKGELIFTGPKGFQIFTSTKSTLDTIYYFPSIADISINHEQADFGMPGSPLSVPVSQTKRIDLPYDRYTLGFEIKSINHKSPQDLQYSYMLDNYDNSWIDNKFSRNILYTKIPPGKFTLRIRVTNNDGLALENNNALIITIGKPWWHTWWAYGLYLLTFLAIAIGIYTILMNRQKMKMSIRLNKMEAEKFKELDSMKSKFFNNISHEFRTPLTLILGPIDSILKKTRENSTRSSLNMMKRNAQQLQQYINEILDLTKLEAKHLQLRAHKVDIVSYLKYLKSSFESRAKQKEISLNYTSDVPHLFCYVDPKKFYSVASNLISNAIKYTPHGGNVDVSVSVCKGNHNHTCVKEKGCAVLTVRDNGIGIPKDKLPFVFNRYYRIENEFTDYTVGTGLGLSLVKELIQLHHGDVDVKSKPGEFTEFIVRFPIDRDHLNDEEIIDDDIYDVRQIFLPDEFNEYKDKEQSGKTKKTDPDQKIVLIIDDNEDMRTLIRTSLDDEYQVIEAEDGEAGERLAIDTCPNLIVCDVSMPKKDGLQVAKDLKSNEITSHIPIIMLTGRAKISDKISGLETGVDDYMVKPFDVNELSLRIRNLLDQRDKLYRKFNRSGVISIPASGDKSMDDKFLIRVIKVIQTNLSDEKFNVHKLLKEVGVSRTQLHRKLKATVKQSANEMILNIRMQKASEMLKGKTATVAEVAFLVGYSSPQYFSRIFKQHFGHSPKEHVK